MNLPRTNYGIGIFSKKEFPQELPAAAKKAYTYLVKGKAEVYTNEIPQAYKEERIIPISNSVDEEHQEKSNEKTLIVIPEKEQVTIHLSAELNEEGHHQDIDIITMPESELTIIDEHQGNAKWHTQFTQIYAKEKSKVTHIHLQKTKATQHYIKKAANVGYKAKVIWQELLLYPQHIRTRIVTNLNEEQAATEVKTVYIGAEEQEYDIKATVHHNAPKTESRIQARGALKGKAKTILRGAINIKKGMSDCKGMQEEHTLLLSPEAKINAVPNLEIANNNVQCSHSSAISTVDEKKVFYAMARGLSKEQAEKEIVNGFLQSMLQNLEESSREEIQRKLEA